MRYQEDLEAKPQPWLFKPVFQYEHHTDHDIKPLTFILFLGKESGFDRIQVVELLVKEKKREKL